jgi:pimeloyl-ACP methyl ester carboxylesterase
MNSIRARVGASGAVVLPCATALVAVVLLLLSGCATPVGLTAAPPGEQARESIRSAVTSGELSGRTVQILELEGLPPQVNEEAAAALRAVTTETLDAERLVALAEVSYLLGLRYGSSTSIGWQHFAVATFASWGALFTRVADLSPYQATAALARQLHNASIAQMVQGLPQIVGQHEVRTTCEVFDRTIRIDYTWSADAWDPAQFTSFAAADDFRVVGLRNRNRLSGVGAALVGERVAPPRESASIVDRRLPTGTQAVALSVAMHDVRFKEDGRWVPDSIDLRIHDPNRVSTVEIAGRRVPLEADYTAAFAQTLGQKATIGRAGFAGLFRVNDWSERGGLFMLEPFDPNRIPVVMVHGLVSSPLTWREMVNDLWSDPAIRSRYQFWFFFYPTGKPFPVSADFFRRELAAVRAECDPDGTSDVLDRMVLVGHSMGGLVSRLALTDPGDVLWRSVSDTPFDELRLVDEDRELFRRVFFSPPVEGPTRVVFIAVPHRGSRMADGSFGRIVSRLVRLPPSLIESVARAVADNDEAVRFARGQAVANGVDSLSPNSKFLQALAELPLAPGIRAHSIIANRSANAEPGGTDGVVPWSSSHVDFAESELIVPNADHSVTLHPAASREVRRILLLHAAESR